MEHGPQKKSREAIFASFIKAVEETFANHDTDCSSLDCDRSENSFSVKIPTTVTAELIADLERIIRTRTDCVVTVTKVDQENSSMYVVSVTLRSDMVEPDKLSSIKHLSEPVRSVAMRYLEQIEDDGFSWELLEVTDNALVSIFVPEYDFTPQTFEKLLSTVHFAGVIIKHDPETNYITFSPQLH